MKYLRKVCKLSTVPNICTVFISQRWPLDWLRGSWSCTPECCGRYSTMSVIIFIFFRHKWKENSLRKERALNPSAKKGQVNPACFLWFFICRLGGIHETNTVAVSSWSKMKTSLMYEKLLKWMKTVEWMKIGQFCFFFQSLVAMLPTCEKNKRPLAKIRS